MFIMFVGFPNENREMWMVWLNLVLGQIVGAAAGFAVKKYAKIGILLLGIWLGGLLGSVMYSCLFRLISEEQPLVVLWLSIIFFAGLIGYLSQRYFHFAVMVGSAALGSFTFYRVSVLPYSSYFLFLGDIFLCRRLSKRIPFIPEVAKPKWRGAFQYVLVPRSNVPYGYYCYLFPI